MVKGWRFEASGVVDQVSWSAKLFSAAVEQIINPKSEALNTKQYLNPNAQKHTI
jgi:hypothetical protein